MQNWTLDFSTPVDTADRALNRALAQTATLVEAIKGVPLPPSAQRRLDAVNVMRAVRGTIGIGAPDLREADVFELLASSEQSAGPSNLPQESGSQVAREARNATDLLVFVETTLAVDPAANLSEDLMRDFHRRLTSGVRYQGNVPGQYRSHPVPGLHYRAPAHSSEVRSLLREFVGWFNQGPPQGWDPVVRAVVAHFYVISIRPFGRGNGRTARAVESFLLTKAGVNVRGYRSLANFYHQNALEYVETLDAVRSETAPDLTPFVRFAVNGLVGELRAVHRDVMEEVRLISYRDHARELVGEAGKVGSPVGERLLGIIFMQQAKPASLPVSHPISLREVRRGVHPISRLYEGVGLKTLSRDINLLKELRLVDVTGDWLTFNLDVLERPAQASVGSQVSIPGFS
jgi:Fic family protein